jgi:hypothetical protein
MTDSTALLAYTITLPVFFCVVTRTLPAFIHWLGHKRNWPVGPCVTWRRKADGVLMVGHKCPMCGKLTAIGPDPGSYKRMLRNRK